MVVVSRGYSSGKFALELEGKAVGFLSSVEGGEPFAPVVNEPVGPDSVVRKHPGPPEYSPIRIGFGTGMSNALYQWMGEMLDRKSSAKSGAIVFLDFDSIEQSRLVFDNALISEIAFPAIDVRSSDVGHFSLTIRPEATRSNATGSGARIATIKTKAQKSWRLGNFRLKISGLEDACTNVSSIDALVVRRSVTRSDRSGPVLGVLDVPNLSFRVVASLSKDFFDWLDDFVVKGNGQKGERGGTLEFLDSALKTPLFTLTLGKLGVVRVRRERIEAGVEVIARAAVECYCEELSFAGTEESVGDPPAAAAAGAPANPNAGSGSSVGALASLGDALLGILSGRLRGEEAVRGALEIARAAGPSAASDTAELEIVARRLLATARMSKSDASIPVRDGASIGERWATGRATLDELKSVAAIESSEWSALRLGAGHSLIAELRDAGLVRAAEDGPLELERSAFVEGIVAGASGVLRSVTPHLASKP